MVVALCHHLAPILSHANHFGQPACRREGPKRGKQEISAGHHDLVEQFHSTVRKACLTHLRSDQGVHCATMLH